MSLSAHNWARDLKTLKSSTLKAILKELACFENGTGNAWCDIPTLVRFTDLNRKTVITGLAELERRGVLQDTKKRAGLTKQIPIYRLIGFDPDFEKTRREEETEKGSKGAENGTLTEVPTDSTGAASQAVESKDLSSDESMGIGDEAEGSQNRNGSKTGTVPDSAGNSTVFGRKESQKRDTNGSNGINRSDARAIARGARAAREAEPPKPLEPAELRAIWASRAGDALLRALWDLAWKGGVDDIYRRQLREMPSTIRTAVPMAVDRILATWGAAPITDATIASLDLEAAAQAVDILELHRGAIAA